MHRSDSPSLTYRPDIDGLRAIAVLSVIGFHASASMLPGGYVGVDIFFVISGYLISSIIGRQLQQGSFTFRDFYARRCKRIFPALIIVLFAVFAFGWLFLLPDEYARLGKHIAAGAGFISNFALWRESGYFDKAAETKPLLHLWSLGIEEQFYLLWPPLCVLAWKRKWDLLTIAAGMVCVLFVSNVILISLWQSTDMYYLPPTRFWELLLGGSLAYVHLFRKREFDDFLNRAFSSLRLPKFVSLENLQAACGMVLITISLVALDSATLFPGWWGLLPTFGALLLISAGPWAWINRRVLASRALVFIGLISYPLYLWHWPWLSYANIIGSGTPSLSVRATAVAAAFVLSWLTYRIVEKPFRLQPNTAALVLAASLTVVACFGMAAFGRQIHARSEAYGVVSILKVGATANWGFPGPHLKPVHTALGYHFEQDSGPHKVLFIGDSHMEQYYPRIERLLAEQPADTRGVLFVTQRSCAPIHEIRGFTPAKCAGLVENAFDVAQDPQVDTVVIGAAWNRYDLFRSTEGDVALADLSKIVRNFKATGKRVYLILPIPRGESFDPSVLVKRSLLDMGFVIQQEVDRSVVDRNVNPVALQLARVAQLEGARVIDPVEQLCRKASCPTLADNGLPVYTDDSHLGSSYVREHVTFLDSIVLENAGED